MRKLILMLPVALAFGCAHKAETKSDSRPTAAAPTAAPQSAQPNQTPIGSCNSDLDCSDKQLCIRNHCTDISAGLAECANVRVHFPFNSADLDTGERKDLERSARCLKADHALHVTIEGNADERGTEEYNLALGDKRATTVAKYLESLGASNTQLKTVSYGKENPVCTEHDEACWAKNRRAELEVAQSGKKKKH